MKWFNVDEDIDQIRDPTGCQHVQAMDSQDAAELAGEYMHGESAGEIGQRFEVYVIENDIAGPPEFFEVEVEWNPTFSASRPRRRP